MEGNSLYYVIAACGFVVVRGDTYGCTYDPREATSFETFYKADQAAKHAIMDFIAEGKLDSKHQYFAIFQPAFK